MFTEQFNHLMNFGKTPSMDFTIYGGVDARYNLEYKPSIRFTSSPAILYREVHNSFIRS